MWFNQPDKNFVPGAANEDDAIRPGWYFVNSQYKSEGPFTWEVAREKLLASGDSIKLVVGTNESDQQFDRHGRKIPAKYGRREDVYVRYYQEFFSRCCLLQWKLVMLTKYVKQP